MGAIAWKVIGVGKRGDLVWGKRSVEYWDLLLYGEGTRSDLFEEWNSLILEQKHGIDFETQEVTRSIENKKGYTLIELTIVVAILGILSMIAMTKAGDAIAHAKQATTLGNLAVLREALTAYAGDHDGQFPQFASGEVGATYSPVLQLALVPTYLRSIPMAESPRGQHRESNDVAAFWDQAGQDDNEVNGMGRGWKYDANPHSSTWGTIYVLCNHNDLKGASWTTH